MSGNYNEHPWRFVEKDEPSRRSIEVHVPVPAIPENVLRELEQVDFQAQFNEMNGNPEGAAIARERYDVMMAMARERVNRAVQDQLFRPSPFMERLRSRNYESFDADGLLSPIQYGGPDAEVGSPFWHGRAATASFPNGPLSWEQEAPSRELDLRRRLDEVREILGLDDSRKRLTQVEIQQIPGEFGSFSNIKTYLSAERIRRLNQVLDYDEVPHLVWDPDDDVNTWGEVTNRQGDRGRIELTGSDRLERGTILDAAARPIRKFRLVEE